LGRFSGGAKPRERQVILNDFYRASFSNQDPVEKINHLSIFRFPAWKYMPVNTDATSRSIRGTIPSHPKAYTRTSYPITAKVSITRRVMTRRKNACFFCSSGSDTGSSVRGKAIIKNCEE
jgi:hypothetical protein